MSHKSSIKHPTNEGQTVRYHSPLPDEDPDQLYVVSEIHFDVEKPRAAIKPINTDLNLPPLTTVHVEDLELIETENIQ